MSRRSIRSLSFSLCALFLTTFGSSRASAQLTLYYTPIYYYQAIVPEYVTLPVDDVLSIQPSGSSTLVTIVSGGNTLTIDFNPNSTSSWYYPISSDMSRIMLEILDVAGKQSNSYAITLSGMWHWSGTTYYANWYSQISFTNQNVRQWRGIDSVVSGTFADTRGYVFGQLILRRFGSSSIDDHVYPLVRQTATFKDCGTLYPLTLLHSSSCQPSNSGVLGLLQEALPYGGIEIEDYSCGDPYWLGPSGYPARFVHCGSWWWN